MKKILFMLPILFAATFFTSFAAPTNPGNEERAEENFKAQFAGADNVEWSKAKNDYSKVAFTWGGHRTEAYFNERGEFVGAIRGLFYAQLPLTIIRAIDGKYTNLTIVEVREITNQEGTHYSILMETKGKRYRLKVDTGGFVEETRRAK